MGSALRSGKLKIKVLRSCSESNMAPLTNGVLTPNEKSPEAAKQVNNITLFILTYLQNDPHLEKLYIYIYKFNLLMRRMVFRERSTFQEQQC